MVELAACWERADLKQGDIDFVSLDPTMGREQRGFRPVFVITPAAFQSITGTAMVAAITTGGQFARNRGFAVDLTGSGTRTAGVVRCDQVRTLDLKQRNARFVEAAPDRIVDEVLDLVTSIIDPR